MTRTQVPWLSPPGLSHTVYVGFPQRGWGAALAPTLCCSSPSLSPPGEPQTRDLVAGLPGLPSCFQLASQGRAAYVGMTLRLAKTCLGLFLHTASKRRGAVCCDGLPWSQNRASQAAWACSNGNKAPESRQSGKSHLDCRGTQQAGLFPRFPCLVSKADSTQGTQ